VLNWFRRKLGMHVHEWSPWRETGRRKIYYGLPPLAIMFTNDPHWYLGGERIYKQRECSACGKTESYSSEIEF
jgi:hypothetical protein